jgi:RND family efflux transporter MFP subunit
MLALAGALAGCGSPSVHDAVVYKAGPKPVADHPGGVGTTSAGITVPVSVDFRDLVTDIGVRAGDQVRRGQPLISLDPQPFQLKAADLHTKLALLTSQIQSAQARLAGARDAGQQTALQEQINSYQGEYAIVQQQIAIAEGHATQILSPIDGVIGAVNILAGGFASPGQVLLTVLDLSHVEVTANLPIADYQVIHNGASADITFTNLPGVQLTGRVVQVAASASGNGTVFQATIDAPNTIDKRVVPGLQAYVRVAVEHSAPVVVSKLAVLNVDQDPTVFVVEGQVAHRQHVEIGLSDGTFVEVLQGLKAGDLCVIVGNQGLDDLTPVRITSTEG